MQHGTAGELRRCCDEVVRDRWRSVVTTLGEQSLDLDRWILDAVGLGGARFLARPRVTMQVLLDPTPV